MFLTKEETKILVDVIKTGRLTFIERLNHERAIRDTIVESDPQNQDGISRSEKAIESHIFTLNTADRVLDLLESRPAGTQIEHKITNS